MSWSNHWPRDLSAPINLIQDELQRVVTNLRGRAPFGPRPEGRAGEKGPSWSPAVDLFDTADSVVVVADLPGVDPASVDLSVAGNVLSLRGDRKAPDALESETVSREHPFGPFLREIPLPGDVDAEAVEARLLQGVLTVTMTKAPAARAHSIPIRSA